MPTRHDVLVLHGTLHDTEHTQRLAEMLGDLLVAGDCLTLTGDLGAGKSTFARAFIRHRAAAPIDVPSPSFTLVQDYALPGGTIIHADLYRLKDPDEVHELGLDDLLTESVCLIEWPDRLPEGMFPQRIDLELSHDLRVDDDNRRQISIRIPIDKVSDFAILLDLFAPDDTHDAAERSTCREELIDRSPWRSSEHQSLPNDMSLRRYHRYLPSDDTTSSGMLMDAPPAHEDVRPFMTIAAALHRTGLSAPRLFHAAPQAGYLMCEDLGAAQFSRILTGEDADLPYLEGAIDVLEHLSKHPSLLTLPAYDETILVNEAMLFADWYLPWTKGAAPSADVRDSFRESLSCLTRYRSSDTCLVLRDYHVDNLIWLADREGVQRVGLLDFQDALSGAKAYDVMSLLEDARRDMPQDQADHLLRSYLDKAHIADRQAFLAEYEALALQRHLKVLGIFTRYAMRTKVENYLVHLPRLWRYITKRQHDERFAPLFSWLRQYCPDELRLHTFR